MNTGRGSAGPLVYAVVQDYEERGALVSRTPISRHRSLPAARKRAEKCRDAFLALFGNQFLPWAWLVIDTRDFTTVFMTQVPWGKSVIQGYRPLRTVADRVLGKPTEGQFSEPIPF